MANTYQVPLPLVKAVADTSLHQLECDNSHFLQWQGRELGAIDLVQAIVDGDDGGSGEGIEEGAIAQAPAMGLGDVAAVAIDLEPVRTFGLHEDSDFDCVHGLLYKMWGRLSIPENVQNDATYQLGGSAASLVKAQVLVRYPLRAVVITNLYHIRPLPDLG
jgi:hypothetical protein